MRIALPRLPKKSATPTPNGKGVVKKQLPKKRILLAITIPLLLLIGILGGVSIYSFTVVQQIKQQAFVLQYTGQAVAQQLSAQNLPGAKAELEKVPSELESIKTEFNKLSFFNYLPITKEYYADGLAGFTAAEAGLAAAQKAIYAVEPYADVLGLNGQTPTASGSGTAENRIKLILDTLDKAMPELDAITANIQSAVTALQQIDANRYPEQLGGQPVRPLILQAQNLSQSALSAVTEFRPVIEQIPVMAGGRGERLKYLVLFQNDNELRPTGGFLTAFSTIYIEDGKVTPETSDDIYALDAKYRSRLPIPEALGRYLTTEKYWNLRDMNTSPDFKVSMEQFLPNYMKVGDKNIDGIITVDTEVLKQLLEVLGPVQVPGYGTFSAEIDKRCDCPQVVYALSEIITRPTNYIREDRKGILGPFMRAVLSKAYDAPSEKNGPLFQAMIEAIQGRHIQVYYIDESLQKAAEAINVAGRMTPPTKGEDFFAVINANLGGAKSNLFTTYEMVQQIEAPTEGKIKKTVEITYKNNRRADNCNLEAGLLCLNSTLRDWTRIYVPAGSELIEATGFTKDAKIYDELGFTVFDGFFILEPNGVAKIRLTYSVPYALPDYQLQLWKQGGITDYPLTMEVTGGRDELTINKDTLYTTTW
ncbi:MAG TPA: DUF4012 domain-containing protein [Candidatus Woesebacteria bacterium]|nr:DUF4012 domain-containing protein [Candidatus Woesebacteria bacterium]HNS65122.1 DUF4012 domain-containing protein [Candidatus Woesebacteria bacterium]